MNQCVEDVSFSLISDSGPFVSAITRECGADWGSALSPSLEWQATTLNLLHDVYVFVEREEERSYPPNLKSEVRFFPQLKSC